MGDQNEVDGFLLASSTPLFEHERRMRGSRFSDNEPWNVYGVMSDLLMTGGWRKDDEMTCVYELEETIFLSH